MSVVFKTHVQEPKHEEKFNLFWLEWLKPANMYNVFQEDINSHIFHLCCPLSLNSTLRTTAPSLVENQPDSEDAKLRTSRDSQTWPLIYSCWWEMFQSNWNYPIWNYLRNLVCFWFSKRCTQKKQAIQKNPCLARPPPSAKRKLQSRTEQVGDFNGSLAFHFGNNF